MLFNEKVIKYDEKCKILINSRYKVKSPLSEKVTYNLYILSHGARELEKDVVLH